MASLCGDQETQPTFKSNELAATTSSHNDNDRKSNPHADGCGEHGAITWMIDWPSIASHGVLEPLMHMITSIPRKVLESHEVALTLDPRESYR
jgi:hypothetical protein